MNSLLFIIRIFWLSRIFLCFLQATVCLGWWTEPSPQTASPTDSCWTSARPPQPNPLGLQMRGFNGVVCGRTPLIKIPMVENIATLHCLGWGSPTLALREETWSGKVNSKDLCGTSACVIVRTMAVRVALIPADCGISAPFARMNLMKFELSRLSWQ